MYQIFKNSLALDYEYSYFVKGILQYSIFDFVFCHIKRRYCQIFKEYGVEQNMINFAETKEIVRWFPDSLFLDACYFDDLRRMPIQIKLKSKLGLIGFVDDVNITLIKDDHFRNENYPMSIEEFKLSYYDRSFPIIER